MFFIFVSLFLSSIYLFCLGTIGNKIFFNNNIKDSDNYFEIALIGIIFASILAFLINFFSSLNKFINDLLFIIPILFVLFNKNKYQIAPIKFFELGILCSLIGTILISYDNVYRPDAGSYHLPFISILNENKIIIGLSNLHFRFGHTSIIQYLSASFNNHIFNEKGILIPHALIFSFFLMFLIKKIFQEKNKFILFILFCFFSFVMFRMNRYSSFGNDAPSHFYYIYLIILAIYFVHNNNNYFNGLNKIILVSIFIFFNKITMLMSLFIPIIFFFRKEFYKIIFSKTFIILIFVFFSWMFKNILISGCFSFPVEQTCLKSLYWFDKSEDRRSNAKSGRIENEAWTKGAPNQTEKNFEEFISSNDWIEVWINNHGIKILKKIGPFLIFMLFISAYIIFKESKFSNINRKKLDLKIYIIFIINLIGSLIWFFKFPVFRYGYGYLITSFSLLYSFVIINLVDIKLERFQKSLKFIILLLLLGVGVKNFTRILKETSFDYSPWPSIYTDQKVDKNYNLIPYYLDEKIALYKPEQSMCYYTNKTPCTHLVDFEFKINDLKYKIINGYKIYFF